MPVTYEISIGTRDINITGNSDEGVIVATRELIAHFPADFSPTLKEIDYTLGRIIKQLEVQLEALKSVQVSPVDDRTPSAKLLNRYSDSTLFVKAGGK